MTSGARLRLAGAVLCAAPAALAQDAAFEPPCRGAPWWAPAAGARFDDFDFWIGAWQVYDRASGALRGLDTIERDLEGCVLRQSFVQLDDSFTLPGSPYRLTGRSVTGIGPDGRWRQLWTDTNASNLLLSGGRDPGGGLTLTSEWYAVPGEDAPVRMRNVWRWAARPDGTARSWGFAEREGAEPRIYYDLDYRPNVPGGAKASLTDAPPPEAAPAP